MCDKKSKTNILILFLCIISINFNIVANANPYRKRTRQQSRLEKMRKNIDNNKTSNNSNGSIKSNDENSDFDNSNISEDNLEDLNNTFSKRRTRQQSKLEKMRKNIDNNETLDNFDTPVEDNDEIENNDFNNSNISEVSNIEMTNNNLTIIDNTNENNVLNQNETVDNGFVPLKRQKNILVSDVLQFKQSLISNLLDNNNKNTEVKNLVDVSDEGKADNTGTVITTNTIFNEINSNNNKNIKNVQNSNYEENKDNNKEEQSKVVTYNVNNKEGQQQEEHKKHQESNDSDKNNEKSKQNDKNIKAKSLYYINMHNNILNSMLNNTNIVMKNNNLRLNLKYDNNINNNIIYNNKEIKNKVLQASISNKFSIIENDFIKLNSTLFVGYNNVSYNNKYYPNSNHYYFIGLLNNIYVIDDLDISLVLNFLTNKETLKDNNVKNNSFSSAIDIAYKIDLSDNFTVKPGFYISYINVGKINDYKYSITNIPNVNLLFKFDKLTANFAIKYFINNNDLVHDKLQDLNMANGIVCSTGIGYEIYDNFNVYFNTDLNKNSTNKFNLSFGINLGF